MTTKEPTMTATETARLRSADLRRAADEIGPLTTAQVFEHAARLAPSAPMRSSAELCLAEARELLAGGDEKSARARAVYSLKYSVGILSPLYQAAIK